MKTELEAIVTVELEARGMDLVELRVGGGKRRPVLDVRIEHRDGRKVTIDDCAGMSRVIEGALDAASIPSLNDYVLEVSSAGVERPLRKVADWRRFVGRSVSVLSPLVGGRKELELEAIEGEEGEEVAILRNAGGEAIRVPLAGIKEARLVFHWKR